MISIRHNGLVALLAMACALSPCRARAAAPASETEVKAVLLFHLTQFVTWPAEANRGSNFVIGVLASEPMQTALKKVVEGERVGQRPIRVIESDNPADLRDCNLVYVSPSVRQPLARVLADIKRGSPSLLVGDTENFIEQGGHIRFRQSAARKIRLQIHLGNTRGNGFQVSAQLLRVCDVVAGGGE